MGKGPNINLDNINLYVNLDTGIRFIIDYMPISDSILMRIDCKIKNRQYHAGLACCYPKEPKPGQKISPLDDLISPKNSVENCLNLKVNKEELVRSLKELLADLESDVEE